MREMKVLSLVKRETEMFAEAIALYVVVGLEGIKRALHTPRVTICGGG